MSPFICGTGSFHQLDEQNDVERRSPCSTPRKSKKSSKDSKNPYSSRGLDKFSALLTELEEKRQKIYSQMGSEKDVSLVRFVYSNANDCVPIVVKLKDQKQQEKTKPADAKEKPGKQNAETGDNNLSVETLGGGDEKEIKQPKLEIDKKWSKFNLQQWRRPSYYMPVAMVLILLFLIFFGRSFAILCTSLGWYLVPALSTSKIPMKKKQPLRRRLSEPKMVAECLSSPRKNNNGGHKSPPPQEHRKSF